MVSLRIPKSTPDDIRRIAIFAAKVVLFTSLTIAEVFMIYVFFCQRASFDSIDALMRGVLP